MDLKTKINSIIDELGITRSKAAEIMEISYNTLKQKNSDKSDRHSWNETNLKKLEKFRKKYDEIF